MISTLAKSIALSALALGLCGFWFDSSAHADPCKLGYRYSSTGVCISERNITISCGSTTFNGDDLQLLLQPYPGRTVACFRNGGGDQSNIVFGNVVHSPGCLYQHPAVDGRSGSAVILDFCSSGPRANLLLALPDIVCDSLGGPSATCHKFYRL